MQINGKTNITGIFGYPVEHTLSPQMHNAAFKALNLNYCYVPFLVHPDFLEIAVKSIRALNIKGVNITIPHKEKVIPLLDEISEEASFIGAVNTILNQDGKLIGYNTDGRGFMYSLAENGISIKGKNVLIIGAGGAARSISYYLSQDAKMVYINGRTKERLEKLIVDLKRIGKINILPVDKIFSLDEYHIIINATPLGLKEDDPLPVEESLLKEDHIICDIIYKRTKFIDIAQKKGCKVVDGTGMLIWQGALAFELWTGKKPDVQIMRMALTRE